MLVTYVLVAGLRLFVFHTESCAKYAQLLLCCAVRSATNKNSWVESPFSPKAHQALTVFVIKPL